MKHIKTQSGTYADIELGMNKKKGKLIGKCTGPCPYCSGTMIEGHLKRRPTRDHIRPKSRFPKSRRTIIVCSECNWMKSDLTLEEFLSSLEERNAILLEAILVNNERIQNIKYLLRIGIDKE